MDVYKPWKTIVFLNLVIRKLLAHPQVQPDNSIYITAKSHIYSPLLSAKCMHGLKWLLKQMRNAASRGKIRASWAWLLISSFHGAACSRLLLHCHIGPWPLYVPPCRGDLSASRHQCHSVPHTQNKDWFAWLGPPVSDAVSKSLLVNNCYRAGF